MRVRWNRPASVWRKVVQMDDSVGIETEVTIQGNMFGVVHLDTETLENLLVEAGYVRDDNPG